MPESPIVVPEEWKELKVEECQGVIMVIGATDTGKSTLAKHLYERICKAQGRAAFLDGDPGQSVLGPPTTISIGLSQPGECEFPPHGKTWRKFIGSTTPSGHMLPLLVGAARLTREAFRAGYPTIVYDTSGLIDPIQGGQALKYAKFDFLEPQLVIAIQRESELEPLLTGLRRSKRSKVAVLKPCEAVQPRQLTRRQAYRARKLAEYFARSKRVWLDWTKLAVLPTARFSIQRLAALEDRRGYCLGLGIILEIHRERRLVELLTPLEDISEARSLYLGDVSVDVETFRDQRVGY